MPFTWLLSAGIGRGSARRSRRAPVDDVAHGPLGHGVGVSDGETFDVGGLEDREALVAQREEVLVHLVLERARHDAHDRAFPGLHEHRAVEARLLADEKLLLGPESAVTVTTIRGGSRPKTFKSVGGVTRPSRRSRRPHGYAGARSSGRRARRPSTSRRGSCARRRRASRRARRSVARGSA